MDTTNISKKNMDDQMKKLEKIIEQTKVENEALRKLLKGLEKMNGKKGSK